MKSMKIKRMVAVLSSAAMLAGALPSAAAVAQAAETGEVSTLLGDVNNDGKVTVADAVAILQYIANKDKYNITGQALDNADVYNRGDGVTARDALSIQRLDAKLITALPESVMEPPAASTTTTSDVTPIADITYIHLSGTTAAITGEHAAVNGSVITIDHSGTFYVDGTLDDGQINVNIADEVADPETVKIYLNGASVTGKSAPALLITNAENTSINLVDGTENFISDGDTAYAGDDLGAAVIEAKDDITIKGGDLGTGILNVTANTQDGIVCNNDIKINGGTVNVTTLNATDKTNAINGKKSVTVKDGTLTVEAEGDGVKSGKGDVAVSGGTVTIKAGNDAVQSGTTIDISGGTVIAGGDRGLTGATGVNITGGTVYATATDYQADSKLFTGTTQTTVLLNCIDDASNEKDGMWKKANTIVPDSVKGIEFTKKYKYVIISDPSISNAKSCGFTNTGTGAAVTHSDGKQKQFQLGIGNAVGSVTIFDEVDPSGGAETTPVSPAPSEDGYTITLGGADIATNAPTDTASVSNSIITIKKAGVFAISGEGTGSQIVVDVDKAEYPDSVVELDLIGMSLTNTETAPVYINSIGDEVQIVAKAGTVNTISDGTTHSQTYTDSDGTSSAVEGAVFARDDIKFKGTGTLTINGNQDDAIVCKNDIKIYNGTITVNAVDDGIRGKDSVTVGDDSKSDGSAVDYSTLKLTVNAQNGDGIKSTASDTSADKSLGLVTINGGTVDIRSGLDGIQAEQEFIMNGGDLIVYTYEGSGYTGSGSASQSSQGGNTGRGGFGGGFGMDGNANKTDVSAKGIKAVGLYDTAGTTWQSKGDITINGGNITIDSSDDSLHCGGDMNINGGVYRIATADDGFHSDHTVNIGKTAANTFDDVQIFISRCYEGIEGTTINQNSGSVYVISADDGYNAGGGSDGSGAQTGGNPWSQGAVSSSGNVVMNINGGFVCVNSASGDHDAFDSNGDINLNGGYICANGQEPLDCGDGGSSVNYNGTSVITLTAGNTALAARYSFVDASGRVIVSFVSGSGSAGQNCTGCTAQSGGTLSGGTKLLEQADSYSIEAGGSLTGSTQITASTSSGGRGRF